MVSTATYKTPYSVLRVSYSSNTSMKNQNLHIVTPYLKNGTYINLHDLRTSAAEERKAFLLLFAQFLEFGGYFGNSNVTGMFYRMTLVHKLFTDSSWDTYLTVEVGYGTYWVSTPEYSKTMNNPELITKFFGTFLPVQYISTVTNYSPVTDAEYINLADEASGSYIPPLIDSSKTVSGPPTINQVYLSYSYGGAGGSLSRNTQLWGSILSRQTNGKDLYALTTAYNSY